MNLFGSHVPSDLLLLEDAQGIQIKKYFGLLAVCRFNASLWGFLINVEYLEDGIFR
jgi:hypothetical protein